MKCSSDGCGISSPVSTPHDPLLLLKRALRISLRTICVPALVLGTRDSKVVERRPCIHTYGLLELPRESNQEIKVCKGRALGALLTVLSIAFNTVTVTCVE